MKYEVRTIPNKQKADCNEKIREFEQQLQSAKRKVQNAKIGSDRGNLFGNVLSCLYDRLIAIMKINKD